MAAGGLAYLGAATALPRHLEFAVAGVTTTTITAAALALLGWRFLKDWAQGKRYLAFALVFTGLAVLSGLSAWNQGSVSQAITLAVWYLFILPGLVGLLRMPSYRWALILGLASATAVVGLVVAWRVANGDPVFDARASGDLAKTVFGRNRNHVNQQIILLVPFLGWLVRERPTSQLRWALLALVAFPLAYTGGRAGLAALACALLLLAVLQPGVGRSAQALLMVVLLGSVTIIASWDTSGPLGASLGRISSYVLGERTSSDEARDLLTRKALAVAGENPVFGVGLGNFRGMYHPIDEEATTYRSRQQVRTGAAHNTYVQVLADIGYPGGLAFYALLVWALTRGILASRHLGSRLSTAGMGGYMAALYFDYSLGGLVVLAVAIVLGSTLEAKDWPGSKRQVSLAGGAGHESGTS